MRHARVYVHVYVHVRGCNGYYCILNIQFIFYIVEILYKIEICL